MENDLFDSKKESSKQYGMNHLFANTISAACWRQMKTLFRMIFRNYFQL